MHNSFDPNGSGASSESAFMPMVDALMVILSIFFIAFVVLSVPDPIEPPEAPEPHVPTVNPPISLESDRYFASASFSLSEEARTHLRTVLADSLKKRYSTLKEEGRLNDIKFIIIEGHADRMPHPSAYYQSRIFRDDIQVDGNEELSYFRAFTVFHELMSVINTTGVFADQSERIIVAGTGSRNPLIDAPGNVEQNRRIVFHFVFDEAEGY